MYEGLRMKSELIMESYERELLEGSLIYPSS